MTKIIQKVCIITPVFRLNHAILLIFIFTFCSMHCVVLRTWDGGVSTSRPLTTTGPPIFIIFFIIIMIYLLYMYNNVIIFSAALKMVEDGGTVVYSTCSLSPVQNDGVVKMALKRIWQETNDNIIVKSVLYYSRLNILILYILMF